MKTEADRLNAKYDQIYEKKSQPSGTLEPILPKQEPIQRNDWPTDRNQALIHLARPGGRFLEVGCGTGAVLATLAKDFDKLVGIELSTARANRASEGLAHLPNCQILNEPLERLPDLFEQPFDCIVWADVLEHVVDVIEAMHILAKLSHVGTQLVTTTPNVAFLPYRLRILMGKGPNTALPLYPNEGFAKDPTQTVLHDAGHFHYFTFRQVEILYKIAGFQPEKRLGFGRRLSRLRNVWTTMLSGTICVSGTYRGKGIS